MAQTHQTLSGITYHYLVAAILWKWDTVRYYQNFQWTDGFLTKIKKYAVPAILKGLISSHLTSANCKKKK
jgi:hypothetical protein